MPKEKIIFIDLLYSENGSYDDDFQAIKKSLSDINCVHLKYRINDRLNLIKLIIDILFGKSRKIVFLSAKINHLIFLSPILIFFKTHAIYHFMPNSRIVFHSIFLRPISFFVKLGTYSNSVSQLLRDKLNLETYVLPSRIVEKEKSELLLKSKFSKKQSLKIFVPGVRNGVRKFIEPEILYKNLVEIVNFNEIQITIQSENLENYKNTSYVKFVPNGIKKEEYDNLFINSHIVAVEFENNYEVRASGIILDAISAGCIVLTNHHDICDGYGFPHSLICDYNHLIKLINKIQSGECIQDSIPGDGLENFKLKWKKFLNF